jgi:MFS family permease
LAGRLFLGQMLDRCGTRPVWIGSTLIFVVSCVLLTMWRELSWPLYAIRVLFSVGLAGMFSCSMVHIQNRVPALRRTEVIASLGASGFLGMVAGTFGSDLVFAAFENGAARYAALFSGTLVAGLFYLAIVAMLTWGDRHVAPSFTVPLLPLARRYWPGPIVLVAMMIGMNFAVISIFLSRYATYLGMRGVSTFFLGYTLAAFGFRLLTRTWGESVGRHRMVLLGLLAFGAGQWGFPLVRREWHFLLPALVNGFGHALLFPAVVSIGAGKFPVRYRGTGTTLALGCVEFGTFLAAPLLGGIIDAFDHTGFSPMFLVTGGCSFLVAIYYQFTAARRPDVDVAEEE